jgi:hypothetical protein
MTAQPVYEREIVPAQRANLIHNSALNEAESTMFNVLIVWRTWAYPVSACSPLF